MADLNAFDQATLLRVRRSDALAIGWQTGAWWMNGSGSVRALQPLVDAGLMEQHEGRVTFYRFTEAGMAA
jgi:hypothetical protein